MHLTLISADLACHSMFREVARLLDATINIAAEAQALTHNTGGIIIWHMVEADNRIAAHLASFSCPLVLLLTRAQLGPSGGRLLIDPMPSLPELMRLSYFILLPFDPYDAVEILRQVNRRAWLAQPHFHMIK